MRKKKQNKKGFLFSLPIILYMSLSIIILILFIWAGFRLSSGIKALLDFFTENWWIILIAISGLLFYPQIRAIINFALSKVGIKI